MSAISTLSQPTDWKAECRIPELTEKEIDLLYQEGNDSKSVWHDRKELAMEDEKVLKKNNTTYEQIAEKFVALVLQANKESKGREDSITIGNIQIENLTVCLKMIDRCMICSFQLGGPRKLEIRNISNEESMSFIETAIHFVKRHHYFGRRDTLWRVDPETLCKILL